MFKNSPVAEQREELGGEAPPCAVALYAA